MVGIAASSAARDDLAAKTAARPNPAMVARTSRRCIVISLGWKLTRFKFRSRPRSLGAAWSTGSIVKVDALFDDDIAIAVLDNVVAVQPVAIGIEIVGSLDAAIGLDRHQGLANLFGRGVSGGGDRLDQHVDGVIGPRG